MSGLRIRSTDPDWFTSSYTSNSQACVEVARTQDRVLVRDTKNRAGGTLAFTPEQWSAFVTSIRR
ncbi:hypothetical protein GCM10009854_08020 [Saccharopolyspora halophila]|uniref:DUF397 domain-containing protein n=1 Tax=Saccharopolyspora halophila TaxID=405551 RepID=A0ABN3FP72_9PSEU